MKRDVFGGYLQSQAAHPENARELQPLSIAISRETAAGGRTIADLLCQKLAAAEKTLNANPWAVFDSSLAKQVLEDHKLPPNLERFMTEDARLLPVEDRRRSPGASSVGLDAGATHDQNHPPPGWSRPRHPGRARCQRHHRTPP